MTERGEADQNQKFFQDMMTSRIDINDMTPEELIMCEKEAKLNFWSLDYAYSYQVSLLKFWI